MSYTKEIRWSFEVMDELLELSHVDSQGAVVSEVRKNGQEDTHMREEIMLDEDGDFVWAIPLGDKNSFEEYCSKQFADAILEYIKRNGLPC